MLANPPYNVSTQNKNEWIDSLIDIYKTGLHEKKLNLDDDYIKFIRYGQYYIDKNKNGIEAYISNNSFIDGVTHRQMRKSLLQSFDKIYILNLHGSAKKKKCAPDGGKDENVFDIQQGVSINIFIKTGSKKEGDFATVYYHDLYGNRGNKYSFLLENKIDSIGWKKLDFNKPYYFFYTKEFFR
jgi:predicted helicase